MKRHLLALVVLAGCTRVGTGQGGDIGESRGEGPPKPIEATRVSSVPAYAPVPAPAPAPAPAPTPPPAPPVATQKPKIELTSVTLADDCTGGSAAAEKAVKADMPERGARSKAKRRCEQTSMQLSIEVFGTTKVSVKSVELFDERGKSLGSLAASRPRVWSATSGTYEAWNEQLSAGPASNVTYVLSQPRWSTIGDRWNRTFTVKAVITLDGVDVNLTRAVELRATTSLPPGVKT